MEELKTYETYAWMQDVFTNEEVEKIKLIDTEKVDACVGNDIVQPEIRKSKVRWVHSLEQNKWIYEKLNYALHYINTNFFRFDLDRIETLQLTEYDQNYGGFYSKHVDIGYDKNTTRKLSFVMFLTDPTEYEGGELLLYNSSEAIKPDCGKGKIVFFPGYVLHEVTPVTKGTRCTLVGWVHGPRFK